MELIDRDKLIEKLEEEQENACMLHDEDDYECGKWIGFMDAIDIAKDEPVASGKKEARWKCTAIGRYYCSWCNTENERTPYCPMCGAKMEENDDRRKDRI